MGRRPQKRQLKKFRTKWAGCYEALVDAKDSTRGDPATNLRLAASFAIRACGRHYGSDGYMILTGIDALLLVANKPERVRVGVDVLLPIIARKVDIARRNAEAHGDASIQERGVADDTETGFKHAMLNFNRTFASIMSRMEPDAPPAAKPRGAMQRANFGVSRASAPVRTPARGR